MKALVITPFLFAVILLSPATALANAPIAEVIQVSSVVNERETLLNPGKFLNIPTPSHETALILSGQRSTGMFTTFNYRTRLTYDSAKAGQRFDAKLQEASVNTFIQERWVVNVGKTQLSWDMATSFQPLGFFQANENLYDLTDMQSRSTGLPLMAASYLHPSWSATLVYSDDRWSAYDGFNRGVEQWGGRFQYHTRLGELSFIVQKPAGQNTGAGFSYIFSPADFVVTYTSAFYRQGTRRPQNLLLVSEQPQLVDYFPFSHHEKESVTPYWRGVLGASFVFSHLDLTLELSHDKRGLDRLMWDRLSNLIQFHNELLKTEMRPEVRAMIGRNLFFASQSLSVHGAQENYLFAYLKKDTDYANMSLYGRMAIQDKSALVGLNVQRTFVRRLTVSVNAQKFIGGQQDEFGLTPVGSSYQLTFRYLLN
ncbi:hypothetical protein Q3O60_02810 [Alkalimonas collagenimarina]|uniref:Uncharacterized protein n=1 Tax=Alkalimonas collagenimarina TaxID=400390 RepID=A0ABT9GVN6_9GAMM|nr:hypothetical protein [Alkalimonas collagenimarina]MDP4535116.1 hypothetical protein [Alkalimonas collagenimarina]